MTARRGAVFDEKSVQTLQTMQTMHENLNARSTGESS
jgi:hypothetical protein